VQEDGFQIGPAQRYVKQLQSSFGCIIEQAGNLCGMVDGEFRAPVNEPPRVSLDP
jgi:hypothetical protein